MTTKKSTVDIGIAGSFVFNVYPITELTIKSAHIEKNGHQCKLLVSGSCKNLPDQQKGTLILVQKYNDSTEPVRFKQEVVLKINGAKFELCDKDGKDLLIDPIACGFVGEGVTDLLLKVDFPCSPEAVLEKALTFNFPCTVRMHVKEGFQIGAECTIYPEYDPLFEGSTIKWELCESDTDEPEDKKKSDDSVSGDYEVSFEWKGGSKEKRFLRLGCSENLRLLYANEYEHGDFEFSQKITISRGSASFERKLPPLKVPKPQLEAFSLSIEDTPFLWKSAGYFFTNNKPPDRVRRFKVEGKFSGFAPDLLLQVECTLLAGEGETLFWAHKVTCQILPLKKDGTFDGIIAELLPEDLPVLPDEKGLVYFAALRIAGSYLNGDAVPVERTFSTKKYLPASAYTGCECLEQPRSWVLSSPINSEGKKLAERSHLVTIEELKEIMPEAKDEDIQRYIKALNDTLLEFEIINKKRIAHFLCHIPVETGNLRSLTEIKLTGDKYRGRGLLQLTGEANYKGFADYLKKPDILTNPEQVATDVELACRSAGWWWMANKVNEMADREEFIGIVYKVNHGYNGLVGRWEALKRAYKVFGLDSDNSIQKMREEANKKVKGVNLA